LLHVAPEGKCEGGDRIGHVGYFWGAPTVGEFVLSSLVAYLEQDTKKSSAIGQYTIIENTGG
jgi:hypothetical protein